MNKMSLEHNSDWKGTSFGSNDVDCQVYLDGDSVTDKQHYSEVAFFLHPCASFQKKRESHLFYNSKRKSNYVVRKRTLVLLGDYPENLQSGLV